MSNTQAITASKSFRLIGLVCSLALFSSLSLLMGQPAQASELPDARAIMEKVDAQQQQSNDNSFSRLRLSSCRFGVQQGQVRCIENPSVRVLEGVSMNLGDNNKDNRSLLIVLEPSSERGLGMLSYSYDDPNRDNETWLYLSALNTVRRIASGGQSSDNEPVALFGSEFTTEDQETGKLDDYDFALLESTSIQGREVWLIETTPRAERARTSRYSRTLSWIDQERLVPLRVSTFDRQNQEYKRFLFSQFEEQQGLWRARSVTAMNLQTSRLSSMQTEAVQFGVSIEPEFLTQRALTDQSFRERHLNQLRAQSR